jgi:DNA helicase II / ATP-dependent DNA helicase PcrA
MGLWRSRAVTEIRTILIDSGETLEDLDHPFRVSAGPGSGKTYWLISHIRNVLRNSKKLTPASRIACITYTTVASEEIKSRLNEGGNRVDVSTIHSFLYTNVIKTYAYLLKDENDDYLVSIKDLDGHEEHRPSGIFHKWINQNPTYRYLNNTPEEKLISLRCLMDLSWRLVDNECKLILRNPYKGLNKFTRSGKMLSFPSKSQKLLLKYKKLFWKSGRIHHEDVLYLSYRILKENPDICSFLSIRYPYIFIDEFQDTNPIQTKIITWLANAGSIVGVIGDPAQSIYQFQDARRDDFIDFNLPGLVRYEIKNNRRSTNKIINLLNYVRKDDALEQRGVRDEEGTDILVVTSDNIKKLRSFFDVEVKRLAKDAEICVITRYNDDIVKLKNVNGTTDNKIWDNFRQIDPNRESFFYRLFLSIEYANQGMYEMAVKEFLKNFRTNEDCQFKKLLKGSACSDLIKRCVVLTILEYFITNWETLNKLNLYANYNSINSVLSGIKDCDIRLPNIKKGKFYDFAEKTSVADLISSLKLFEDKSNIRTIHGTKGTEYQSVLLYVGKEHELNNIIHPNINDTKDDCRIYYVALSRAKDFICISILSLSNDMKAHLAELGMKIVEI